MTNLFFTCPRCDKRYWIPKELCDKGCRYKTYAKHTQYTCLAYEFHTATYSVFVSTKENKSFVYGNELEAVIPKVLPLEAVIPKVLPPKATEEDINKLLLLM